MTTTSIATTITPTSKIQTSSSVTVLFSTVQNITPTSSRASSTIMPLSSSSSTVSSVISFSSNGPSTMIAHFPVSTSSTTTTMIDTATACGVRMLQSTSDVRVTVQRVDSQYQGKEITFCAQYCSTCDNFGFIATVMGLQDGYCWCFVNSKLIDLPGYGSPFESYMGTNWDMSCSEVQQALKASNSPATTTISRLILQTSAQSSLIVTSKTLSSVVSESSTTIAPAATCNERVDIPFFHIETNFLTGRSQSAMIA